VADLICYQLLISFQSLLSCLSISLSICCSAVTAILGLSDSLGGCFRCGRMLWTPWIYPGWVGKTPDSLKVQGWRCNSGGAKRAGAWGLGLGCETMVFLAVVAWIQPACMSSSRRVDVELGICLMQGWQSHDSGDRALICRSPTSPRCMAFDKLLLFSSCCLVRVLYAPDSLFEW